MAYQIGTGANQQDLLDAVRAFALGLGWTIVEWNAGNKRLKLEKGLCHASWTWATPTGPPTLVRVGLPT